MRNPKLEELNEDLKIDALKNNILQIISSFKVSPTITVYVLKDLLIEAEKSKQQYMSQSYQELQVKLSEEEEKETTEDSSSQD